MAFWTRHKIPYVNFHELNEDWIVEKVSEYIKKTESIEEFMKLSIDEQNAKIENALKEIADKLAELNDVFEELKIYITNNLRPIANEIINELIATGELYIGTRYDAQTEELDIVLSRQEV